jgi:cell wall-associated NlpC family hydrolase
VCGPTCSLPMPSFSRSRLLAFALAAFVFSCAPQAAQAKLDGPPRRHVKAKPSLGQRAAKVALGAVGVPYSWGGSSPSNGFDCSGLVYWAYSRLGVSVPHSSYALYGVGRRVPRSALRAGDVLFFSGLGHVGLYVGRGRMVHAPQSGRNVEVVRLRGSNYGLRLVGARRITRS